MATIVQIGIQFVTIYYSEPVTLIKVVDIIRVNAILKYHMLYAIKPLIDDFWVFTLCALVMIVP